MIKGNVIEFGYGDVLVVANGNGFIEFIGMETPIECGEKITHELVEEMIITDRIKIYEETEHELYDLFRTVNENNRIVKYKEFTFDFTNYNKKSVDTAVGKALKTVNIMALAC